MPQEIKKIPIVIASILKPVDDTRMLEKLGLSINKMPNVTITIIGYPSTHHELPPTQTFISFKPFKRLSLARIKARITFLRKVLTLKPKLIILTTHELLLVSILAKWSTGCQLIYDVQENYYRNILHSRTFPILVKQLVAGAVRLKEIVLSHFIDHFFLAEASYQNELTFLNNRYTILQNKVSKHAIENCSFEKKSKVDNNIHLIFSGTLATSTGIFEAIRWAKSFHQLDSSIRLTIIGYCSIPTVLKKIREEINDCDYISLIGGNELVPHKHVLEEISKSDGGFITYQPNASTSGSIPTKLFEYLAFQLPIFLVPHQPWVDYCKPFRAAILLEDSILASQLLSSLKNNTYYSTAPQEIYWEDQEPSLFKAIKKVLG